MNQLTAGNADSRPIPPDRGLLGELFSEFLDEAAFADFRQAGRLVASLKRQGMTVARYSIARPADYGRITAIFSGVLEASQPHFCTHP